MIAIWETILMVLTTLGGWIGYYLGAGDGLVVTLLAFIILDLLSELLADINEKKLSSSKGFKTICEKVLILIFVAIGHILDFYVIKTGSVLRTAVIFFYLANEGLCLIENASKIGLPIPTKLTNALEKLHDEAESKDDSKPAETKPAESEEKKEGGE